MSNKIGNEKFEVHTFVNDFFTKMTISLKWIDIFIFCKKELIVHTLSIQIKAIYNFCQKKFLDPPIPLKYVPIHLFIIVKLFSSSWILYWKVKSKKGQVNQKSWLKNVWVILLFLISFKDFITGLPHTLNKAKTLA